MGQRAKTHVPYAPAFRTDFSTLIAATLISTFALGLIAVIGSMNRETVFLDKSIATYMSMQPGIGNVPFNKGALSFLSRHPESLGITPVMLIGIAVFVARQTAKRVFVLNVFDEEDVSSAMSESSRLTDEESSSGAIRIVEKIDVRMQTPVLIPKQFCLAQNIRWYFPLSFLVYGACNACTILLLKYLLSRPRPWQTIEFSATSHCLLEYRALFDPSPQPNPCRLELYSTPSGHTNTAAVTHLPCCLYIYYVYCMLLAADPDASRRKRAVLGCGTAVLITGAAIVTAFVIGCMMVARLAANMHFLSDTLVGFFIAVFYLPLLILLRPDYSAMHVEVSGKKVKQ